MDKPKRQRRQDYTLETWTDFRRERERGYDAKRRAKRREGLDADARRALREAAEKRANPPPSEFALETVLAAAGALYRSQNIPSPEASETLIELHSHLRERLACRADLILPSHFRREANYPQQKN